MKHFFKTIILFFLILAAGYSRAQDRDIDSLLHLIQTGSPDTNKINSLNKLAQLYIAVANFDTAIYYSNEALSLSEKLDFKPGFSPAYTNIGISHHNHGNFALALEFYLKGLKIDEALGNQLRIAKQMGNIAVVYKQQQDYEKALNYDRQAMLIFEKLGSKKGMAAMCNNIGSIYNDQLNYKEALKFYWKALALDKTSSKSVGSMRYGSIGVIHQEEDRLDSAEYYYKIALAIAEEGGAQSETGRYLVNIGSIYVTQKKFAEAEKLVLRSLSIFEKIGFLEGIKESNEQLSILYEATGDAKKALKHYRLFTAAKDSLFNQEKNDDIVRHELNYEFEKKEATTKAEQDKKEIIAAAEQKKQRLFLYLIASIALGVTLSAFLIYRSLKTTRGQKKIIEDQKTQVEEKQKEIMDSIHYARRIQKALMTSEKYFSRNLSRLRKNK